MSQIVPDTTLSVGGLTTYIQDLLEPDEQLHRVWVTGEVSSTSQHPKGIFFTLQDPDTRAVISCVAWSSQRDRLDQLPVKGEQLTVLGGIRIYPQKGQYQLMVWQAIPAGVGLQALRFKQLRDRLSAEGLFDAQGKRSLPPHPQTIAVVTSPQAAAWGDIQKTLKQRYPGLHVLFSPAIVQGEQAPASIAAAIERVNKDGRAEVLILARGGGASEELACFNDERVVRAIADCSIPVITGIGHQRDESLADLVADVVAHTPTAAAEKVVPELAILEGQNQQRHLALSEAVKRRMKVLTEQLQGLEKRLQRLPLNRQLEREMQAITWKRQQLIQATTRHLDTATQHCEFLREKLDALDPRNVLQRGYAVVRSPEGTIVRSTGDLVPGEELTIQLDRGKLKVKIIDIDSL